MADFFNRVEVRDITGATASVLFDQAVAEDRSVLRHLRNGSTLFGEPHAPLLGV